MPRIRCAACSKSICASAKAAWRRRAQGRVFLTVYVPAAQLVVIGAVHISQALAPIAQAPRLRRDHRRSAHRVRDAGALSRRQSDRGMAGRGAAAARRRSLHRLCRAHPRSEDRRSRAAARACRATVSISARSARERPMRAASSGSRQAGLTDAGTGAHPCADRSRHRRGFAGRDRGRDHGARSPSGCARSRQPSVRGKAAHEIRRGRAQRGDRRHRGAHHPPRRAGAQEGHADRPGRSGRAGSGGHQRHRGGAARAGRRLGRCRGRRTLPTAIAGDGVHVDRAFTGRANLFAQSAGVLVVDKEASTASTASTRTSRLRRCRPSSRSWPAR